MIYFSFLLISFLLISFLLLLVILFLIFPIHILIYYNGSLLVRLKILFLYIDVFPFPFDAIKKIKKLKNSRHKSADKKNEPNLDRKPRSKISNLNIIDKIKVFKKILHISLLGSKKILKKIKFKINCLDIGIRGDNAADVATNYGKCITVISGLISFLENTTCLKKEKINIRPDFLEIDEPLKLDIDISSNIIYIIYEAMIFAKSYVKIVNQDN